MIRAPPHVLSMLIVFVRYQPSVVALETQGHVGVHHHLGLGSPLMSSRRCRFLLRYHLCVQILVVKLAKVRIVFFLLRKYLSLF